MKMGALKQKVYEVFNCDKGIAAGFGEREKII